MSASDGRTTVDLSVAGSANASSVQPLGAGALLALEVETGTGAFAANSAKVAFKVGMTASALDYLRQPDGTLYTVTVTANNTNGRPSLDFSYTAGWRFVQAVVLDSSDATVTQSSTVTITGVVGVVIWPS